MRTGEYYLLSEVMVRAGYGRKRYYAADDLYRDVLVEAQEAAWQHPTNMWTCKEWKPLIGKYREPQQRTSTMIDHRTEPPYRGSEKETLLGFLHFLRETIVAKCSGLTDEQIQSRPTVSSMSLLGMVKHLRIVERYWFQAVFLDTDIDIPWSEEDPNSDWHTADTDLTHEVIEAYIAECAISDKIVAEHDLDSLAKWAQSDESRRSLRWILTHMVEETGRHCGHADILREAIDGVTGE